MNTTDLVAWWGAITSTLVSFWTIYQYIRSGPVLRLQTIPNLETESGKVFLAITITNVGGRRTKLKDVAFAQYPNGYTKGHKIVFGLEEYGLPIILEPGDEWVRTIDHSKLQERVTKGSLFLFAYHSFQKHPNAVRVVYDTSELIGLKPAQIESAGE